MFAFLRWIDYEVLCCTIVVLFQEPCPPLYSQEARVLVGLQRDFLVGLLNSSITKITWEES